MWFGTYDGLNRYDGYEFKIFRNILEDSNSLPHNFIYAIAEDSSYNLWVGTGQGIGIYSNITGSFSLASYRRNGDGQIKRITSHVNTIAVDPAGTVYVGTNGTGLMVKQRGQDAADQFTFQRNGKWTTDYNVTSIKIDRQGQVWMFISRIGLCRYDKTARQIVPVSTQLNDAAVVDLDKDGHIWVAGLSGLYQYQPGDGSFQQAYSEQNGSLRSNRITSLCNSSDGKMWIGTQGAGATVIDAQKHVIKHLLPGDGPHDLSSEVVSAIYEDREKRKWIGTLNGGITIYYTGQSFFHTLSRAQLGNSGLTSDFAACFHEHPDGNIWIGTAGGGITVWNRAANRFSSYRHVPGKTGTLSSDHISSIIQDHQGDVWVSTFGGGINRWNNHTKTFRLYKCKNTYSGIDNDNVWIMFEDRNQTLWATTFGSGCLYYLNRQNDRFEVFSQQLIDLLSIYQDRNGVLWGGTAHELIRIDPADQHHVRYEIGKPVRAIHEDKTGRFWIGAEGGGLILFDRAAGRLLKRFTVKDGLCNNGVLNLLEDSNGNIWMSTFYGLSQFNTKDARFKNYFQDDGLQSNQFLYGAALKLHTGEMLLGGVHGFNLFNPAHITGIRNEPLLLVTDLRINNLPLSRAGHYIRQTEKGTIQAIEMPYDEAAVTINFAALEYDKPNKITYASFLQGWDKDWNYSGRVRTISYTKLHEGTYTLRIKATDAEGAWSARELTLRVRVLPPWYRSWWAYGLYATIFIAGIVLYQRYRINQAKLEYEVALAKVHISKEKAEREKAEAEYKTYLAETEMEKIKLEKEQEINDKRLAFFTHITHEFRTPISLIINPVKELLQRAETGKKDLGGLKLVYRNARRLLHLVDQLLLFRKAEAGADRLRIVRLDLSTLCKEVFLAFEHQAQTANIRYHFQSAGSPVEIYSDREKLEIVFFNLLSNAFKYTPAGGSITVTLTEQATSATVSVQDTGPGIPGYVGEQLFERFYQVQHRTPSKPGFGIGLYLVKHFVDSLKGKVWYESREHEGSTFYIQLLKGHDHIDEELIVTEDITSPGMLQELVEEPAEAGAPVKEKNKLSELDTLLNEKKSILVVDDDAPTTAYLAGLFGDNFCVYTAHNAADGLKLAGQHVPDIIISDINMEGRNGIEFCMTIKEDPNLSHIPVILLTGNSAQQTRLEGLEGGADDYITKPFDKDVLMARVLNILKSRTTLQKYFYNEITFGQSAYKVAPEYQRFLDTCIKIVEAHLDNPDFGIKMLAAELHMGQSNLYKKIKSICGQPPNAFIRFIRLRKAAKLLMETNLNISEAAFEAGFNDMKYFREQFTKLFGLRPSDYLKAFRKGLGKNGPAEPGEHT
jgi:signal transduction histidine kinase/ligand-binding sensor domain-containing protein/CheY-like chemotaxis protein